MDALKKPKIGEKCNGCGICCVAQVCRNGAYLLGLVDNLGETISGPCPAIARKPNGEIRCGVVLNPNKYIRGNKYPARVLSKHFASLIGVGTGCDELLPDDTPEEEEGLLKIIEALTNDSEWIKKGKSSIKIIHGLDYT
jgi:hypothetical protein